MQTETMSVTGMTCGGCTSKVTHALEGVDGVQDVKVSLAAGEATVQYDEQRATPDELRSAVKHVGYGVNSTGAARGGQAKGGCCG